MAEERLSQPEAPGQQIKLRTLAPEFEPSQHGIYVRHLEEAVLDKRNRNIALTGRYGAGKSSVLDDFQKKHHKDTVRISINTLGPDKDDEDLTNRIQKELVKQLVYRLTPGKIRRSRFARPKPVTKGRAFLHALFISVVGLGLLWVLGVRSGPGWPDAAADLPGYLVRAGMLFSLVLASLWAARWIIGDRIVSEVTTAGTKIALGEGPTTYFDSFLDEIVAFFDTVKPRFVIFEDLDRFEDPQIFDSLRELNTLINASANWPASDEPLRFIYAIKDSLFEQLGKEPESKDGEGKSKDGEAKASDGQDSPTASAKPRLDIAAEAVRRANRTKFFEIVVPMVPFISHRNARDLLAEELEKLGLAKNVVSRPLLDLIARHTTDMRLMKNICNEFVVFAEHLLWTKTPAPGMTVDHLFALVAYKNFHLADFEAISQRTSTLDELERLHRDEVRTLIEGLQEQRRKRMRTEEQRERKEETALELGQRLRHIKDLFPPSNGWQYIYVKVDDQNYAFDAVDTVAFWERVAKSKSFSMVQRNTSTLVTPSAEQISRVFPEVMNSAQWLDPDPVELARLIQRYDQDIATLRGADFAGLARYERVPKGRAGFDQRITDVLESGLARDLVRRGFITRNYAEYSAIFYGSFVGVDVAFFYNHSVQPNEMYLDHEFTSENAISNLLEQVPADFTSSVSALNLQVASYLLKEKPEDAKQLVAYVVTHDSKDVQVFLDAFLNAPNAPRELLVQQLTKHPWLDIFEYVANHPGIPDEETRLKLFDAALMNALHADAYEIGESSRALLESSYPRLTAVRESLTAPQTERVFEILETVELLVTDLGDLSAPLRDRIVAVHRYEVSAPNLQLALGIDEAPTLDEVRKKPSVWEFCKTRIDDYIAAMEADGSAQPIVLMESVLVDVINEQHGSWTEDQLRDVIERSSASATIQEIEDVPEPTWPLIVDAGLMAPTVANVSAYAPAHGVDEHLSGLLVPDGADPVELRDVEEVADQDRGVLAVRVLNASAHLTAQARVQLVKQLNPESAIELAEVTPSPDQLLARALEGKLLPDTFDTFAHFAKCGWESVSEAFAVSENASEFMTPALVAGFVGEFVESPWIPDELRRMVVEHLGDYVPGDDKKALRAAGQFAIANQIWLPLGEIRRIARVTQDPDVVLRQLTYAKDTDLTDLSGILASLGQPYDDLSAGPGIEFDLPAGSSNETLFKRLEAAGRIEIVPKLIRGRKVRNLV
ncbi:hypothetical protein NEK97_17600 [Paenarthrobacter sp. UW852]|uniref:YobI family P-loop NTPase n=1 Tax=Paenarthrobacter sp. UW852 TaxID=2951989 RepID=UPI0021491EB4|nr:hypothetical protein [Paenarthrobacter sp. UW852]MCR1163282.1 hypothetical protein [Paenarthrobacter sp. UW852]